ncbi:hypothetical protein LSAT2_032186, partial [Lamellibrachia satsuma]
YVLRNADMTLLEKTAPKVHANFIDEKLLLRREPKGASTKFPLIRYHQHYKDRSMKPDTSIASHGQNDHESSWTQNLYSTWQITRKKPLSPAPMVFHSG